MKMMGKIALAVLAVILCYGFAQAEESEKYKKAFQYKENYICNKTDRHNRIRGGTVYISPINEELSLNSDQLASTCMAAAKYYVEEFSKKNNSQDRTLIDDIGVIITDMPYDITRDIKYGNLGKLAECNYVLGKSKGLFSYGEPEWQWLTVVAASRNTDDTEKKIENLWVNLYENFKQGNTVSENDLKREIAKVLNINIECINFTPLLLNKIDIKKFEDIVAQGPLDPGN